MVLEGYVEKRVKYWRVTTWQRRYFVLGPSDIALAAAPAIRERGQALAYWRSEPGAGELPDASLLMAGVLRVTRTDDQVCCEAIGHKKFVLRLPTSRHAETWRAALDEARRGARRDKDFAAELENRLSACGEQWWKVGNHMSGPAADLPPAPGGASARRASADADGTLTAEAVAAAGNAADALWPANRLVRDARGALASAALHPSEPSRAADIGRAIGMCLASNATTAAAGLDAEPEAAAARASAAAEWLAVAFATELDRGHAAFRTESAPSVCAATYVRHLATRDGLVAYALLPALRAIDGNAPVVPHLPAVARRLAAALDDPASVEIRSMFCVAAATARAITDDGADARRRFRRCCAGLVFLRLLCPAAVMPDDANALLRRGARAEAMAQGDGWRAFSAAWRADLGLEKIALGLGKSRDAASLVLAHALADARVGENGGGAAPGAEDGGLGAALAAQRAASETAAVAAARSALRAACADLEAAFGKHDCGTAGGSAAAVAAAAGGRLKACIGLGRLLQRAANSVMEEGATRETVAANKTAVAASRAAVQDGAGSDTNAEVAEILRSAFDKLGGAVDDGGGVPLPDVQWDAAPPAPPPPPPPPPGASEAATESEALLRDRVSAVATYRRMSVAAVEPGGVVAATTATAGYEPYTCDRSGALYWVNLATGESTWDVPGTDGAVAVADWSGDEVNRASAVAAAAVVVRSRKGQE